METNVINLTDLNHELKLIDISQNLSDYEDEQITKLCSALSDEKLSLILEQTDDKSKIRIIDRLTNEKILKLFSYMQKDDIVDILGILEIGKAKTLINLMKSGERKVIEQLLGYADDTAGGIMTTEYIAISSKLTIKDTIKKIRQISPKTEVLDTLFTLDGNKKLIGTVELRDILVGEDHTKIEDIMNKNFVSVEPEVDQEEVALMASKYDLTVIPVVNKKMMLLGIITIDDIVDVMVEEQTEDILKMGGVDKEENIDSTLMESISMRLPWLVVNLVTAFLAALTVRAFESTIAQVVALSSIMSIVTGMGGNAGTQTVSIIIRNIAMGKVELSDSKWLLRKEILLGIINGAIIGLITGIIIWAIYGNFYLGLIIFLAMIGNLVVSGFFGLLTPLVLHKFHKDPAISSSIFLTTATDVLGFFIFLTLAKIFIKLLI